MTEGTVLEWRVGEGEEVAEGEQTVVEVSTDKIDAEVPRFCKRHLVNEAAGRARRDGSGRPGPGRDDSGAAPAGDGGVPTADAATPAAEEPAPAGLRHGRASPVACRVAAAKGVDIAAIKGSGPGGKVTKEDVLAAADGDARLPPRRPRRARLAAAGPRGDARQGDEREPVHADRDRSGRRPTRPTPNARRSTGRSRSAA